MPAPGVWHRPGPSDAPDMTASDRSQLSRTDFLATLTAAGLAEDPPVRRAIAGLARDATGSETARALVAAGALTTFQASRLLAGKTEGFIVGRYVVLDQIGVGPAARVYRARHQTMDRLVAIKVFAAELTRDSTRRAAVIAEARRAAQLGHPNLVTVLDVNQAGPRLYVVMEYVDAVGADGIVRNGGPLSVARACEIARQALLGVRHAHEAGIVHAALGPWCILVEEKRGLDRPSVKVTGFGLGLVSAPAAPAANPFDYRAPELLDPATVPTPASDLFSLGGLLSFLLTGRPPLAPGGEPNQPEVPAELAMLIRRLLTKDPTQRPDGEEVAATLARFGTPPGAESPADGSPPGLPLAVPSGFLSDPNLRPSDETCPWASLSNSTVDDGSVKAPSVPAKNRDARTGWLTAGGAVGVAIAAAALLMLALLIRGR